MASSYSIQTRSKTKLALNLYLPDECWEFIFKFLINYDDNNHRSYFNSLSLVSKQFLSITNRLPFSLTIYKPTRPFLGSIFHRFTNLVSLDFTCYYGALDALLHIISRFPLKITSLNLSNHTIPTNGLRSFAQNITTLTSLTCSNMISISSNDLSVIASCFPLLEELDLSKPKRFKENHTNFLDGIEIISLALFKLRKINLSYYTHMNDKSLFHLFNNCKLLQEAILINCFGITNDGIASALRMRPTLKSLSFSNSFIPKIISSNFIDSLVSLNDLTCLEISSILKLDDLLSSITMESLPLKKLSFQKCFGHSYPKIFSLLSKYRCITHLNLHNAEFLNDQHVAELSLFLGDLVFIDLTKCSMLTDSTMFALLRNCPSLGEIRMEITQIGKNSQSLIDFGLIPQLKSLYLGYNRWLKDESVIIYASIFPNLELLDLNSCDQISNTGICEVLRRCCKIKHLNIARCFKVKQLRINFEVPMLEVLNLSYTKVDDETLYDISKNCCGILQLSLEGCFDVTKNGLKHLIDNCTQLRELNLRYCSQMHIKVVVKMLSSKASLRNITLPCRDCFTNDKERNRFMRRGCLVC